MKVSIKTYNPPKLPQRFLRWYCKPELLEDIEGDIHEDFNKRYIRSGARSARLYYILDVIRFFRPFTIRNFMKTQIINPMFKINTRIAFRNLAKNKLYSFINITGLAIGIAACLIIAHYVIFQLSFDRFHENAESVYRVNTTTYQNEEYVGTGIYCGHALAPALKRDVPEISKYSRVHPEYGGAIMNRVIDGEDSEPFREQNIIYVEPAFLEMFTIDFLQGDPATALDDVNSLLISESMAKKYFGDEANNALGQFIKASGSWGNGTLEVTGIFKDYPANSHLDFDFLKPISKVVEQNNYAEEGTNWGWTNFFMYAQLGENVSQDIAGEKIADLMHTYTPEDLESTSQRVVLTLQPITDIHLKSDVDDGDGEIADTKSINSVYFMILIAGFILIIAWINFINLSTAKATERGLEVGIKKAIGAHRSQLISQFLTESFWINFIAISLALGFTYLLLPILGNTIGEPLNLQLGHPVVLGGIVGLVFIGPLLAGVYPAFVLSSFKTVSALKGNQSIKMKYQFSIRKGLVVFQFVISTLLIAGTFTVSKQIDFMRNGDTGFNRSEVLVIKGPSIGVTRAKFDVFKNSMLSFPGVENMGTSRSVPGAGYNFATSGRNALAEKSTEQRIEVTWVDPDFIHTYDLELIAGRDFSDAIEDGPNGALVSAFSVEAFNLGTPEEAIGKRILISEDTVFVRGVIEDHNWQSLHRAYMPSALLHIPATVRYMSIRINPQNAQSVIQEAEKQFMDVFPGNPLEYYFMDDFFNRQYEDDQQFGKIFNAFAGFAIFAACLGLFGLASYSVVQKAKEIGIRKVLGASSSHITMLFSKRYMILVVVANLIAIPLSYFAMKQWLSDYAFSIPITIDLFILPILLLAIIATVTIMMQTVRASMANPVKNLRAE